MLKVDIHKEYKSKRRRVRIDCSFSIKPSVTTALYGKSGIGKSSVLRMIAGLEAPEEGNILFNNVEWFSSVDKINIPIAKRSLGFVFQDYNLFPNMTVEKNLKYASSNGIIPKRIGAILSTVGLSSLMNTFPDELSGGQRQRIALLRALCQEPDLLLLDEPFSALDDESIAELIKEIKLIQEKLNTTIIVVSHRKDIIFKMADDVVHLKPNGKIIQGKPEDILKRDF